MALRYAKTDAGREEIRARVLDLARPARTLLLIIDASRSGDEWVGMVNGAVAADLERLVQARLVVATGPATPAAAPVAPAPGAPAPVASAAPASAGAGLEQALQALSYRELYDRLTAEARARLGLIKGYKMVLDIEKCAGAEEIRKLTLRFVAEVRNAQGDAAAREFCRSLGAEA